MPLYRISARTLALLVLSASPVPILNPSVAQQPSPEQIATIRQACRSDFISHCSGVQPGRREALQCLQHNAAQLSAACSSAISAAAPKSERPQPVGAASQPQQSQPSEQEQLAAVRQACTLEDFVSHCSWITPSSPELLLCFRANAAQLSAACQNVLRTGAAAAPVSDTAPAVVTPSPPAGSAPASPTTVAVPPPPGAAAPRPTETRQPSAKQISAIRTACRSDFISHCSRGAAGKPCGAAMSRTQHGRSF